MNRRSSLKTVLGVGFVGISSLSAYKWFTINHNSNVKDIELYRSLIAELANTIIPETDTPGAKSAGVESYIINVISNCTDIKEQNRFMDGLHDLHEYTLDEFKTEFSNCNSADKITILTHFEKKDLFKISIFNKINNKLLGQPFFSKLKSLTVEGYTVSQLGATKGLAYDYIPVNFEACIPLKSGQRSWATK